MAKKHYRAYKKQMEVVSPKGTFVSNKEKPKLYTLLAIILGLVFVKGLLLGYIFGNKE